MRAECTSTSKVVLRSGLHIHNPTAISNMEDTTMGSSNRVMADNKIIKEVNKVTGDNKIAAKEVNSSMVASSRSRAVMTRSKRL